MGDVRRGKINYRCNWIRSLISRGVIPRIALIEEVDGDGCAEEIQWIKLFRENNGRLVNMTTGGEGTPGMPKSPETKRKIREANLGKKRSIESRVAMSKAQTGRKMPVEQLLRRAMLRGVKRPPSTGINIGNALRGKPLSEEHRKKLSLSHIGKVNPGAIGRKASAEARKRMSEANKGKILPEETRQKISLSLIGNTRAKGHVWTPEQRAKLRENSRWVKYKETNGRKPAPAAAPENPA
jgi:hypothetical protein